MIFFKLKLSFPTLALKTVFLVFLRIEKFSADLMNEALQKKFDALGKVSNASLMKDSKYYRRLQEK